MKVSEALVKLQKIVEAGGGDAVLVHTDTRSCITERCHISSSIDVVTGDESDFYVDLETGDTYLSVYEGD